MERVYHVTRSIPDLGALPGDFLVHRPEGDSPLMVLRPTEPRSLPGCSERRLAGYLAGLCDGGAIRLASVERGPALQLVR